ncbi:ketopantoate reductase C-terminal domain-containing protein [Streptomyces sp. DG2A-72]|nr:ketopantoate reductase C-terminal domain-containing protein [Streptomyces sp. DG2A-72]MDO0932245.1 ketopantoate reductase C-terminal domain-containing protein [Streptomyces sp. DG2A-72]
MRRHVRRDSGRRHSTGHRERHDGRRPARHRPQARRVPHLLQDAARGRPLELDAIVGAVRELARRTGVPSPSLDMVHGLLALRERVRGHGESSAR